MTERWMGVWSTSYTAEDHELQTDVMRFMAILAFCLVAIFALVQSMPLTPDVPGPAVTNAKPAPPAAADIAQPAPAAQSTQVPEVVREPDITLIEPRISSRVPGRASPEPAPEPAVREPARAPDQPGLSLRFESDEALFSLVREGGVSLYAIDGGSFWQLDPSSMSIRFRQSRKPGSYHEMVASTVPSGARNAFPRDVTWGVTLPTSMTRVLERLAGNGSNGVLVITASGRVELEKRP